MKGRFQKFPGFTLLAGQSIGISLKGFNSSKKPGEVVGSALFRINQLIVSAQTVTVFLFVQATRRCYLRGERKMTAKAERRCARCQTCRWRCSRCWKQGQRTQRWHYTIWLDVVFPTFRLSINFRTFQMTVKIKLDFPDPRVFFLHRLEVSH